MGTRAGLASLGWWLGRLRQLTGGCTAPADSCASTRAWMAGLSELEADTHQRMHRENNHLFPAAQTLEKTVAA